MNVLLFTKKNCPKCPAAKRLCNELAGEGKINVEHHDIETVDGMTEAMFYSVMSTPTIIAVNNKKEELSSWRGEVPLRDDLLESLDK